MTDQLTFDGTEVPHAKVVKGPSESRVLRRPSGDLYADLVAAQGDGFSFVARLVQVFDRAQIQPGDAFYVSRIPKALPPEPRKSRGAPKGFPRRGMRRAVLDLLLNGGGANGVSMRRDALLTIVAGSIAEIADADRRVRELLEAGFLRERNGRLVATEKARRGLLAEAERRAKTERPGDDHRDGQGADGEQEAVERGHAHGDRPAGATS